ncbi:MAG: sulfate adenylyltransferase [Candidatus Micrarchaeota archaeon]
MNTPYGGKLVNRHATADEKERILSQEKELHAIDLDERIYPDLEMIADGAFSPLEGFMLSEDYNSVLESMRLKNGLPWAIPIVLPVSTVEANTLEVGSTVLLTHNGITVASMVIEEKYSYDKKEFAQKVYNTTETAHPTVEAIYSWGDVLLGGKVTMLQKTKKEFDAYFKTPSQVREMFEGKGWNKIVAFQTRNAPHRAHEYLQKRALELAEGLLIHPIIGPRKKGDTPPKAILDSYEATIAKYYPPGKAVLTALPIAMRYGGPREAVLHSIIRRNFGCTHFIVGRDHAGVGDYYDKLEAQRLIGELSKELGITPVLPRNAYYCEECKDVTSADRCSHPESSHVQFSGTRIRESISTGIADERIIRPEVVEIMRRCQSGSEQPNEQQNEQPKEQPKEAPTKEATDLKLVEQRLKSLGYID